MTYNEMWLSHDEYGNIEIRDFNMPLKIKYKIDPKNLDPARYIMTYGKHEGRSLYLIYQDDKSYIDWLRDHDDDLLLQQCIMNLCQK